MKDAGFPQNLSDLSPEADAVWQRELAYWGLFCQGDPRALSLVADAFAGWPHTADRPQDKTGMAAALAPYRTNPALPRLELLRMTVTDNVAVVHLLSTLARSGEQVPLRVFHTWAKKDGEWFLIGGMGHRPAREQ